MTNSEALGSQLWWSTVQLIPELLLLLLLITLAAGVRFRLWNQAGAASGWLTLTWLVVVFAAALWRMLANGTEAAIEFAEGRGPGGVAGITYLALNAESLMFLLIIVGAFVVVLLSLEEERERRINHYLYIPTALLGIRLLLAPSNLITLYVGLELFSLAALSLIFATLNKRYKHLSRPERPALRFSVRSGVGTALLLFGMSYIYGLTGELDLAAIRAGISDIKPYASLGYMAILLMACGLGVKVAALPFGIWVSNEEETNTSFSYTAGAMFLTVAGQGATAAVLFHLLRETAIVQLLGLNSAYVGLQAIAASQMAWGTVALLRQKQAAHILGWASVINSGYLLVPVALSLAPVHSSSFAPLGYHFAVYMLAMFGATAILAAVREATGHGKLSGLAGLYHRSPWLAAAMVVFVLSFAGLPVTGGFFAKVYIWLGSAAAEAYWLLGVMAACTLAATYAYFGFIRQMFMRTGSDERSLQLPFAASAGIVICAVALVVLGLFPGLLMK
ncbi:NADH-quinone oxidoreductase subunit N [Paenibacillus algorifonticola]|uniref:NADH-quinone oxidoreductase subunit N n=1 Tax=Paenibacillus algorifonticola TaxID=684063 RepID=A0A1I2GFF3_9BACL|nr:proton-conducting transporter membrane subunit [Paenibacillus algorifonticola]SFF15476.1 NADH-quinone oxidoreductase subunit N [Paenibacillus algorifonticola]